MTLQFLSHRWEVTATASGLTVTIAQEDLDSKAIWILFDELYELALEYGKPDLFVDFKKVRCLANIGFGKLITLDKKLREVDCRLVLCNVDPSLYKALQAARLTENLLFQEPA